MIRQGGITTFAPLAETNSGWLRQIPEVAGPSLLSPADGAT